MENKNDFVVVLPSNTPSSIENTPSNYLTTLQQPIHLEPGAWSVGLVELNFKNSIKTINEDYISITKYDSEEVAIKNEAKLETISGKFLNTIAQYVPLKSKKDTILFSNKIGVECRIVYDKNDDITKNYFECINNSKYKIVLEMAAPNAIQFALHQDANQEFKTTIEPGKSLKSTKSLGTVSFEKESGYFITGRNIDQPCTIKLVKYMDKVIRKRAITPGTYSTAAELITELNKDLKEFRFSFNHLINRVVLKSLHTNYTIHLGNGLNDVLGFSKTSYKGELTSHQAEMELDLLRGIGSIFVYCDLCEPIRVGNVVAPLIRNVAFNTTKYGENIHTSYNYPVYLPVCKSFIDSIRITLRDARGDLVPFVEGLTTCLLQFKRL